MSYNNAADVPRLLSGGFHLRHQWGYNPPLMACKIASQFWQLVKAALEKRQERFRFIVPAYFLGVMAFLSNILFVKLFLFIVKGKGNNLVVKSNRIEHYFFLYNLRLLHVGSIE